MFEEHAATEALRWAAAGCAGEIRYPDDAPVTALFTIENERHMLGLGLAELWWPRRARDPFGSVRGRRRKNFMRS